MYSVTEMKKTKYLSKVQIHDLLEFVKMHYPIECSDNNKKSSYWNLALFKSFEECQYVTAVHVGSHLVACVFHSKLQCNIANKFYIDVRTLCVHTNYRRIGIATKLLQSIVDYAMNENCAWLELFVDEKQDHSHETLLQMYKRMGFLAIYREKQREFYLYLVTSAYNLQEAEL